MSRPSTGFDKVASSPAGFVSADDFKASFAALASNDFDKDYFEQPQNRPSTERESYESKPGPSYTPSYTENRAPAQFSYENKGHKKGVATEVHDLTEKPPKQRAPKKYKKPESSESGESGEYKEDVSYAYPSSESYYQPSAQTPSGKVVDYNTGKSSSTVSQNPYSPGHYAKLAQASASAAPVLSPYDKFSFQPASSDYISAVAPFSKTYNKAASTAVPNLQYQASENVDKALEDNKNCKKIDKQIQSKDVKTGRYKRQSMNCFICQDPETKSNFEQCTYTTDSTPKSYYTSATNTYKAVVPSEPNRQKRYSEGEGQVDPYELVKNQKYHSRPKAFDGKHYQPSKETAETNNEYQYSPSYKKEEPKKSFSEQKADELIQKGGENCEKVQREEMSCVVCTSAETGGNYEQCSYSSAPAQQKYAYVREQKFDGPVPDKSAQASHASKAAELAENTKQEAKTEAPRYSSYQSDFHRGREEPLPHFRGRDEEQKGSEKSEKQESANSQNKQKDNNRGSSRYQIPSHFEYETSSSNKKPGGRGLDPRLYGGEEDEEEEETEATQNQKKEDKSKKKDDDEYEFPAIGEYKFKYFPDFLKEESETAESKVVAEPAKKDVEEVLAEFAKKDRSNCQKAEKNGMTCYLCTDKNGLQHEECMYISESVPKQSHVAYHEKQEVQSKPTANNTAQAQPTKVPTTSEPVQAASEQMIKKIKFKATTPLHEEEKVAASNKNSKKTKAPKKAKELTTSESRNEEEEAGASEKEPEEREAIEELKNKAKQKEDDDEKITDVPEPPTPEEFKVGEKEGAYSEETRPVYSKALGVTLPKYMLTKSESEAIFDEFVSSS